MSSAKHDIKNKLQLIMGTGKDLRITELVIEISALVDEIHDKCPCCGTREFLCGHNWEEIPEVPKQKEG